MHGGDIYSNKIKLDFSVSVNPLGAPKSVKKAAVRAVKNCASYPELESKKLCSLIAKKFGLESKNIVASNGASEIISAFCLAYDFKKVLLLAPGFTGYKRAVEEAGAEIEYFYLDEKNDFMLEGESLLQLEKLLQEKSFDLLVLTNPNNPNGTLVKDFALEKIAELCLQKKVKILLDECFLLLAGKESFAKKIKVFPNVIILRAFTKTFAIPGIRLGYCICSEEIAEKIKKILPEWNVSLVAQKCGEESLKLEKYILKSQKKIQKEKNFLSKEIKGIGFKVFKSDANFILFKTDFKNQQEEKKFSQELYAFLLSKKILIRSCSDFEGLGKNYFRIAVKNHLENKKLLSQLKIFTKGQLVKNH